MDDNFIRLGVIGCGGFGLFALQHFTQVPGVTLFMQPSARYVNVGGSVRNPTRVPFTEDMTLLTAINASGGFNDFADQRHVRLLRGNEVTVYDVRQFRRDPSKDVRLRPGDKIEVPQSFF